LDAASHEGKTSSRLPWKCGPKYAAIRFQTFDRSSPFVLLGPPLYRWYSSSPIFPVAPATPLSRLPVPASTRQLVPLTRIFIFRWGLPGIGLTSISGVQTFVLAESRLFGPLVPSQYPRPASPPSSLVVLRVCICQKPELLFQFFTRCEVGSALDDSSLPFSTAQL